MRPIILLALLAIACDTPPIEGPPGPPGPKGDTGAVGPAGPAGSSTVKSGTRLKARVARSPDGASQFLGWWDSELGVECGRKSPGPGLEPRCLPGNAFFAGAELFVDPNCETRAVAPTPDYSLCSVHVNSKETGLLIRFAYHPIGQVAGQLYEVKADACVEAAFPAQPAGVDWRACGDLPEIPLDDFAPMPEHLED